MPGFAPLNRPGLDRGLYRFLSFQAPKQCTRKYFDAGFECGAVDNSSRFLSDVAALLNGKSAAEETPAPVGEAEGKAEGRFFLKDKLCALGLASVRFILDGK